MLPTLYAGGTTVLLPKFSPETFFAALERERATHTFLVPTQSITLLESGLAAGHESARCGSFYPAANVSTATTFDQLAEAFPDSGLYEVYGMTEGFVSSPSPRTGSAESAGRSGRRSTPVTYGSSIRVATSCRPARSARSPATAPG